MFGKKKNNEDDNDKDNTIDDEDEDYDDEDYDALGGEELSKPIIPIYAKESVIFVPSSLANGEYLPRISVEDDNANKDEDGETVTNNNNTVAAVIQPFLGSDMTRILDYDKISTPPPRDTILQHLEFESNKNDNNTEDEGMTKKNDDENDNSSKANLTPTFPPRHCCLRGGYIFYFKPQDVLPPIRPGGGPIYTCEYPKGCVPIDRCIVEFPPGGRRAFREHVTILRDGAGYEFAVRHRPRGVGGGLQGGGGGGRGQLNNNINRLSSMGLGTFDTGGSNGNIIDTTKDQLLDQRRATAYFAADTLGEREEWAKAIRLRADCRKRETSLRPRSDGNVVEGGGSGSSRSINIDGSNTMNDGYGYDEDSKLQSLGDSYGDEGGMNDDSNAYLPSSLIPDGGRRGNSILPSTDGTLLRNTASTSSSNASTVNGIPANEREDIQRALEEFGNPYHDAEGWMDKFFTEHAEYDAPEARRALEIWLTMVKGGLRGAVLDQYECFVEASAELSTVGGEVSVLREAALAMYECVREMREVDFVDVFANETLNAADVNIINGDNREGSNDGKDEDEEDEDVDGMSYNSGGGSSLEEISSLDGQQQLNNNSIDNKPSFSSKSHSVFEMPSWVTDVAEDISALVRECRYTDAVTLIRSAGSDLSEILEGHDGYHHSDDNGNDSNNNNNNNNSNNRSSSYYRLSPKQLRSVKRAIRSIDASSDRACQRLSEGLRRRTEALRRSAKADRADPLAALAPAVSSACLEDDADALALLVQLGRPLEASAAFVARRSLVLAECLNEPPITPISIGSSPIHVDAVIYAAQLSQSFFTCLAACIEKFLDLFLLGDISRGKNVGGIIGNSNNGFSKNVGGSVVGGDEMLLPASARARLNNNVASTDDLSSLDTSGVPGVGDAPTVPAGAVAAVALWCDSEVSKLAHVMGSRIMDGLALSAPSNALSNSITNRIVKFETVTDIEHLRNQLRGAEEMGEYATAGRLRKRIAIQEQEGREGKDTHKIASKAVQDKERQSAIETAAKVVDHAFRYASNNLNVIGLPLTPRLAEYLRPRLKGCEAEVAVHLEDKWEHITFEWKKTSIIDVKMPRAGRRTTEMKESLNKIAEAAKKSANPTSSMSMM